MDTMRVAIAAGLYRNPRGTQVNFHVDNLFGGNTVVLSAESNPHTDGTPHFVYGGPKKLTPAGRVTDTLTRLRDLVRYRSDKVPRGTTREAMLAFLKQERVDVILSEFGNIAPRLAPIAREAGLPIFTYFRGIDASAHLKNPMRLSSYKRTIPELAGIFAVSQFLLDNLASAGVRHPRSFVIPSGVDTALFQPVAKVPFKCIAIGRLIEKKRPDITIRAFLEATKDVPQARLDVIGEGPFEASCRKIILAQGAQEKVKLLGTQPHEVVREKLASSEVFLQHSVTGSNGDTEGLPTSIQEAMACGCIVVSTRHAGIPEAVEEGVSGFLADEGDEPSFATAIRQTLNLSDGQKTAMSSTARNAAINRFDNRKLIRVVEQTILDLGR